MSWQDERKRLLMDTIVFLQQAIGESLVLAVKLKTPMSPEIVAAARYLRRYHTASKPTLIDDLRQELRSAFEVFGKMQPVLLRRHALVGQTAIACVKSSKDRDIKRAA